MEDQSEEKNESYEEVKASVSESVTEDVPNLQDDEESHKEEKPKSKAKQKPKAKPEPAKPGKNDKVECENCGKTMNANTLRYRHVCKPAKSEEIQKEKPRIKPQYSPGSPRSKMLKYYREARIAQQDQKRQMYASWLGN